MRPLLAPLVLVAALALSACHAPVTIVTPAGKTAYTADQIATRVNELENTAIAANTPTTTPTTRVIVEFCVAADQILAQTPAGWQTTLQTLWATAKAKIPGNLSPVVAAAVSAVDVVVGLTTGGA